MPKPSATLARIKAEAETKYNALFHLKMDMLMQMGQEMRQQGVQSGYLAGGYATSGVAAADIRQGGRSAMAGAGGPQFGTQYGFAHDSGGSAGRYSRDYSQRPRG